MSRAASVVVEVSGVEVRDEEEEEEDKDNRPFDGLRWSSCVCSCCCSVMVTGYQ